MHRHTLEPRLYIFETPLMVKLGSHSNKRQYVPSIALVFGWVWLTILHCIIRMGA